MTSSGSFLDFTEFLQNGDEAGARKYLELYPDALTNVDASFPFVGTALHIYAGAGNVTVVELLLRLGSKAINSTTTSGLTPMHYAAAGGHTSMIKLLYRFGATIDPVNQNGSTPLHLAVAKDRISAVKVLLRLGSKAINSPDNAGFIPMFVPKPFSILGWNQEIASMLRACGSNIDPPANLIPRISPHLIQFLENQPMNPEDSREIRRRIYFKYSLVRLLNSLLE